MKQESQKLKILSAFILTIAIFISSGCNSNGPKDIGDPVEDNGITSKDAILPTDIYDITQEGADIFSWESFIALSWPANTNTCSADTLNGKSILSGKGPVVWETYLSSDQVFVSPNSQPAKWCSSDALHIPPKVLELAQSTGVNRFLHSTAKSPNNLDQASGGPLVDQNGRFVRYEIRMNEDEYKYIMKNKLWSKAGQTNFAKGDTAVKFPFGKTVFGDDGAIEIKAAWKVMGKNDVVDRFYTIKAIVYNDESGEPSPGVNPVTLGLVGLHIAHKTPTQQKWVWSTFEQADNLTTSFYNKNCDTIQCPVNKPLPGKNQKELNPDGTPINPPTQVTRVNKIDDPNVDSLNLAYQHLLKGSVWEYYNLVSTQWLIIETMTPLYLANTVQETYLQGPHPASFGNFKLKPGLDVQYFNDPRYRPFSSETSSSCLACHFTAKLLRPNHTTNADFSFMLLNAQ